MIKVVVSRVNNKIKSNSNDALVVVGASLLFVLGVAK